ncbi:hypothetical protein GTZ93_03035 [Corallococcus exiguus]|uniref:HEAT repeat domain-containing protein n=2 Tax=Corallococcus exiguus TaxID=83462 RepID=A0A7X5BR81_9BACT|nr:hypothetical protein [Corallococcus exiguus]NBC38788.1 hypothetical protein [Corallococcus exiguus]TNV59367.1 hypothetical protein FH620_26755 [Corallococcus exiguus]
MRMQVHEHLQSLSPGEDPVREKLLDLLGLFGGQEQLPFLEALLLDRTAGYPIRVSALRAGLRLGLDMSGPELVRLLEASIAEACGEITHDPYAPALDDLLLLIRTDQALADARRSLLRIPLRSLANALAHERWRPPGLFPALKNWMHARWARQLARLSPEEVEADLRLHLRVAVATSPHPESQAFVSRQLRTPTAEARELLFRMLTPEAIAWWTAPHPQAFRHAAETLRLPLPLLLSHFGPERLLRRLEDVVRAQPPPHLLSHAAAVLGAWTDAHPLLPRWLDDPELTEAFRRTLLEQFLGHARPGDVHWGREAMTRPENAPLFRVLLHHRVLAPAPGDREVFLEALHGSDAVAQCFAIEGLLALRESGDGWRDRLMSLRQARHPALRIRAEAGLAREGQPGALFELRWTARDDEPSLRAEAVRWLGEVAVEEGHPVIVDALEDRGQVRNREVPLGSDEAVWALSRRGKREDLTLLLLAFVGGSYSYVLERHLAFHLARQEGASPEPPRPPACRQYALDLLEAGALHG